MIRKDLPDDDLIDLYKGGDKEAFGMIIRRYTRPLSQKIFLLAKDPMLVEDILQETFLKAMKAIESDRYTNEYRFEAWITKVAHNTFIDHTRQARHMKKVPIESQGDDGESHTIQLIDPEERNPEQKLFDKESDYDIQELLDGLPPEQKQVVVLRHFNGLSFKEIGDFTGVSINTALGRMRYGLINLRKEILLRKKGDNDPMS